MDRERLEKLRDLEEDPSLVNQELERLKRRSEPPPRLPFPCCPWRPEPNKKYVFTALEIPYAQIEARIIYLTLGESRLRELLGEKREPPKKRGPVSGRQWRNETVSWLRDQDRRQWGRR